MNGSDGAKRGSPVDAFLAGEGTFEEALEYWEERETIYVRMDTKQDVISCLRRCAKSLEAVSENPEEWKWALVGIHGALQGALIVELAGTDGIGALDDRAQKRRLEWDEKARVRALNCLDEIDEVSGLSEKRPAKAKPFPEEEIMPVRRNADMMTLVKRIRNHKRNPLNMSDGVKEDIRLLNKFRNAFMHFEPRTGWEIEKAGLPRIILNCLRIVTDLTARSRFRSHLNDEQRARLDDALARIGERAGALQKQYNDKTTIEQTITC